MLPGARSNSRAWAVDYDQLFDGSEYPAKRSVYAYGVPVYSYASHQVLAKVLLIPLHVGHVGDLLLSTTTKTSVRAVAGPRRWEISLKIYRRLPGCLGKH